MIDMSTDEITRLFLRQIKLLSVKSATPNWVHSFSVSMPDKKEVSFC